MLTLFALLSRLWLFPRMGSEHLRGECEVRSLFIMTGYTVVGAVQGRGRQPAGLRCIECSMLPTLPGVRSLELCCGALAGGAPAARIPSLLLASFSPRRAVTRRACIGSVSCRCEGVPCRAEPRCSNCYCGQCNT